MDWISVFIQQIQPTNGVRAPQLDRESMIGLTSHCIEQTRSWDRAEKDKLTRKLNLAKHSALADANELNFILINCFLFNLTDNIHYIRMAIRAALMENTPEIGVNINNFYRLIRMIVVSEPGFEIAKEEFDTVNRYQYWARTIDKAKILLEKYDYKFKNDRCENNRALILMDQFLTPPHAPSVDALEFASILAERYNRETMIISTCAIGKTTYSPIAPLVNFNANDTLNDISEIKHGEIYIKYYQPQNKALCNDNLIEQLQVIENFNPALVIIIGACNLLAELICNNRYVFQYPTGSGIPMNINYNFMLWKAPTPIENEFMNSHDMADRFLFHHHPGFGPPTRLYNLQRRQFNIPEDAFCFAIVGLRLDFEIDEEFTGLLKKMSERNEKIHFVFAGNFDGYEDYIQKNHDLSRRSSFVGFQNDIISVYNFCDGYINPTRLGGGSAIVHALGVGLPCLTVAAGDAYEAVRDLPTINDYQELEDIAVKLSRDPELYATYKQKSLEIAARLNSKAPLVAKIMSEYERFRSRVVA